jgi:MYXO-CTERM domain-containing protein
VRASSSSSILLWSLSAIAALSTQSLASPQSPLASGGQKAGSSVVAATSIQIDGRVVSSQARWSGKRIVTESLVRQDDGRELLVTQMGGTVDGIGMVQFPGQPLLSAGDLVSLEVPAQAKATSKATRATMDPVPVLAVIALAPSAAAPPGPEMLPETLKGTGWHPPPGYVRTVNKFAAPLYWSSGCVFIAYDDSGTSHVLGEAEFAVMDAVFSQWRQSIQSCSYLTFELTGREPLDVGLDTRNVIKFQDTRWDYGGNVAGLTTLHFVNDENSERNGEILDADIELNGVDFAISVDGITAGPGNRCLSDLANTLTHEVGHLLGLEHTCRAVGDPERLDNEGGDVPLCEPAQLLPAAIREATMYNNQDCGETIKATPEADDIAGVCGIYPLAADPNECQPAQLKKKGGCAVAAGDPDTEPGLPWLLLVLGVGLWLRRRG